MSRGSGLALALLAPLAPAQIDAADVAIDTATKRLFAESFVIDGVLSFTRKKDPACRADCETTFVPFREMLPLTGVHAAPITVSRELDRVRRMAAYVRRSPDAILVETSDDLRAARRDGRYGVLLYTQQVPRLDGDASKVADWFDAGLRVVQLAYSSRIPVAPLRRRNKLAGGADEPGQGLTALGRQAVRQLVKRGMVIDVSHCSEKTTMDVIAMTDVPITANHANAKALTVTFRGPMLLGRNKSDRELRAIAKTGGVVGINPVAWMLDRNADTRAGAGDFLAHVDYVVKRIGIDHVGVASDSIVDGWGPDDIHYADAVLASPKRWKIVAQRLRREYGYTADMLRKLLGGNFLRVYEAVLPRAEGR